MHSALFHFFSLFFFFFFLSLYHVLEPRLILLPLPLPVSARRPTRKHAARARLPWFAPTSHDSNGMYLAATITFPKQRLSAMEYQGAASSGDFPLPPYQLRLTHGPSVNDGTSGCRLGRWHFYPIASLIILYLSRLDHLPRAMC
ncbi:hypothetical protein B0I35DRAFT_64922 [Stachybotrys elegans]|uniref:Uncharacterized protein n=1 Tax=Stachybotrys elegans TaxID=80388 RepID=A0A8K0SPP6_9HYPO|nr:hypothetical protein B0I35DRAFT_64922 [Stachybotrys elegans]